MTSGAYGEERACNTSYTFGWSDENDMRCATGTHRPRAQTKRKSTRKPSANQRANHFPKAVCHFLNEAQTILPAAQTILPGRANHFEKGPGRAGSPCRLSRAHKP